MTMLNYNQITDQLYVGTCPRSIADVVALDRLGVNAVLNLQSDRDFSVLGIDWPQLTQEYTLCNISPHRYPMVDFDEDNIKSLLGGAVDRLDQVLAQNQHVYLHCTAGRERAPTVATGWLIRYGGYALDDAVSLLTQKRPSNPYVFMLKML